MSDVEDPPASLEDIGAGLVNGTMVTLLGAVLPSVLVWQIVAQLSGWLPDFWSLAIDVPSVAFSALSASERRSVIEDSVRALPLLLVSFWAIRWGVGHIRENLARLRAQRG